MLDHFQISGNVPVSIQLLQIIDRGLSLTTDLSHNLIIQIEMSSCPCILLMLRTLIMFNMTSSLTHNEENLVVKTYF